MAAGIHYTFWRRKRNPAPEILGCGFEMLKKSGAIHWNERKRPAAGSCRGKRKKKAVPDAGDRERRGQQRRRKKREFARQDYCAFERNGDHVGKISLPTLEIRVAGK